MFQARPELHEPFTHEKLNSMKTILVLALAALGLSSAHAGDYGYSYRPTQVDYCAPAPYVVCTHKLHTCTEKRVAYDHCGRAYCYYVTIVTFKDVYNTGHTRTYTQTFRS